MKSWSEKKKVQKEKSKNEFFFFCGKSTSSKFAPSKFLNDSVNKVNHEEMRSAQLFLCRARDEREGFFFML